MDQRLVAGVAWFAGVCFVATIAPAETPLATMRVATGLNQPLQALAPPGDTERLFVVEQSTGNVRILNLDTLTFNGTPYLTISGLVPGYELGLLGMAFDPNYAVTGRFYVAYIDGTLTSRVARGTVSADPDIANPALEQLAALVQPAAVHNVHTLAFGPDGMLYIAAGDGGDQSDPFDRGQDLSVPFGKIWRWDVSGPTGYAIPPDNPFVGDPEALDEIWAYGLRNPWRIGFDSVTGDLYVPDVGQANWEEISFLPAFSTGGANFGWRCREGAHDFLPSTTNPCGSCTDPDCPLIDPIHEYDHLTGCSVTGGFVYRGCAIPDLRGTYFFADYCSRTIWSFRYDGLAVTDFRDRTVELTPDVGSIRRISSFGQDGRGELYLCDLMDGELFKVVPAGAVDPPTPHDYDNDGCVDLFDLARFDACAAGPGVAYEDCQCDVFDDDHDGDDDLRDFAGFQRGFSP